MFAMSNDKSITSKYTVSDGQDSLSKDKYLLDLIFNNYYEQERRFNTIESKVGSMIAFTGVIFTIQATIFSNILVELVAIHLTFKIVLCFILLLSLSSYVYSIYRFIDSYKFDDYYSAVNPKVICEKSKNNVDEHKIIQNLIGNVPRFIEKNEETLKRKVSKIKDGFHWFEIGSCLTLLFSIVLLFSILIP